MLSPGGAGTVLPPLNPALMAYGLGMEGASPVCDDGAVVGDLRHGRRSSVLQTSQYDAAVDSSSYAPYLVLNRQHLRAGDEQSLLLPSRKSPQPTVVVASENGKDRSNPDGNNNIAYPIFYCCADTRTEASFYGKKNRTRDKTGTLQKNGLQVLIIHSSAGGRGQGPG